MDFKNSETKINLMRAFAGESQAQNRYRIAASQAKSQKLYVIQEIFNFTADQEMAHAKVFYDFLKDSAGENINISGGYPVDISNSVSQLLLFASRNEFEEHDSVYKSFGDTAKEEGFQLISTAFHNIAKIEKIHGERFKKYATLLEEGKLFVSDVSCDWICLNCGYVHSAEKAPEICPVCKHDQGFFMRFELSPWYVKA